MAAGRSPFNSNIRMPCKDPKARFHSRMFSRTDRRLSPCQSDVSTGKVRGKKLSVVRLGSEMTANSAGFSAQKSCFPGLGGAYSKIEKHQRPIGPSVVVTRATWHCEIQCTTLAQR